MVRSVFGYLVRMDRFRIMPVQEWASLRLLFFSSERCWCSRSSLAMENLALRQQLSVYKQSVKRPKLRQRDRIFWFVCPDSGLTGDRRFPWSSRKR